MRVQILLHEPYEDIGSMSLWFEQHQADIRYTRFFQNDSLPELKGLDLIVAMGGPMSVNDESEYLWLKLEKQFIRDAVANGIAVLGVCLGAQLISNSLGARVYKNKHKELGWFDIKGISNAGDCFSFPEVCKVFHWHGETFDLPPKAVLLAKSDACENQAFQIGKKVIGLQFHLETTRESVFEMIKYCGDEIVAGPYIQTEMQMKEVSEENYLTIHNLMYTVLSYITRTQ